MTAKFIQIVNVPYKTSTGQTGNNMHALDEHGGVWKFISTRGGWESYPKKRLGEITTSASFTKKKPTEPDDDIPF